MKLIRKLLLVIGSSVIMNSSMAAAADQSGPLPAGRLQQFIEGSRSYTNLPRSAHKPDFRFGQVLEKQYSEKYRWVMDGEQKIGLLNLSFGELEMFRFFPPENGMVVEYKMPEVHHWATLQGPRITIVPQGTWTNRGVMTYPQDKGANLRLHYTETFENKSQMIHQFCLRFDAVLGYIWDCTFELRMEVPQRFEYANLLAGGLADSREDHKRYQKCIWSRRDGKLCYMYQNPLSLMQRYDRKWCDLPDGGFVGWVAERDMNPFLEIIKSTPLTTMQTCTAWYDQHIFAMPPSQKSDDGFYHIKADYRMISLPLPVARELEDAATTMLPVPARPTAMGFRQGVVNDFETSIPAGVLYVGSVWGRGVELDSEIGHSGTRSLRIGAGLAEKPIAGGTPIVVETAKRYRLSSWVRTRGATGAGACLSLDEVFFSWEDVRASHRSKALKGDNDWTLLELEFDPVAGDPFVLPGLVVDGGGTAWFDDLELIEIPR